VEECLAAQKLRPPGPGNRIGEIMYAKGYLKREHIRAILTEQQKLAGKKVPVFGSYELLKKLGQGGMGAVFMAKHRDTNRIVALKVLPAKLAADPEFLERFRREARAASALDHPNIVRCADVGIVRDVHYIAMEYVDGEDAETLINKNGRLAEPLVRRIARQMASALAAASAKGILHRDIKPGNILVDRAGNAKLTDLGLSIAADSDTRVTLSGMTVGTPYYISPEQAQGEPNLDVRTDIYSLGASLYHMVTGRVPFDGENGVVIMTKHVKEPLRPVRSLAPDISEGFAAVIERMMAKRREDRPRTPAELLAMLDALEKGASPAGRTGGAGATAAARSAGRTTGPAQKVSAPVSKRLLWVALIASALVAASVIAAMAVALSG
ncbi:MAG: serine/threonine protein kinase, partial [Planctomycetota bacterium]|nr:serine/threonine protein kinase [Planctomycetota bacterium]